MDSQQPGSGWETISQDEVRKWRKNLPKGHIREFNTAHTVGLPVADHDEDSAFMEKPPAPVIDDPRKVIDDMKAMILKWATENRQNARLAVAAMRSSNPEAFRHRTDDELVGMLTQHLEDEIQKATETVYRDPQNKWDKGRIVDVKDGIWRP